MKVLVFPVLLGIAVYAAHSEPPKPTHWTGTFSNGMKGTKFSFDVAPDGKTVSDVTFQGYWGCAGKLDLTAAGPTQDFPVQNSQFGGVVVEPTPGSAWRFDVQGTLGKGTASGTFRMNISGQTCDTYLLNWTAAPAH